MTTRPVAAATLAALTCSFYWRGDRRRRLFRGAQGKKVLRAFNRILQSTQQLLKVGTALHKVDIRGIDDQEIGRRVMEEEVFVCAGHFLHVFGGNLGLVPGSLVMRARRTSGLA